MVLREALQSRQPGSLLSGDLPVAKKHRDEQCYGRRKTRRFVSGMSYSGCCPSASYARLLPDLRNFATRCSIERYNYVEALDVSRSRPRRCFSFTRLSEKETGLGLG